ncbi:uncharacterized protein LOC127739721 [Arachis duranensis]|uniref:Uncharacterized protein LOC127739721 n=1 Tax=Arachis duranensis TaxID=130453 RepID=A0A9C6WS20_ARADU|nr:uncharacterized protein LOC127739721 [Arachis duranensis]
MKPILFAILLLLVYVMFCPSSTLAARVAGERDDEKGAGGDFGRGIGNAPRGRTPIHPPPIPASPNLADAFIPPIHLPRTPIPRLPRPRFPHPHQCDPDMPVYGVFCPPPSN